VPRTPLRGRIAIVTPHWGEDENEQVAVTRLVAGALARQLQVDVLHLDGGATQPSTRTDSAFTVHAFPHTPISADQELLARLALGGGRHTELPAALTEAMARRAGRAEGLVERLDALDPDAVVLVGTAHPYDTTRLRGPRHRRVVLLPVSANMAQLRDRSVRELAAISDLIIATHPGEERTLREALAGEGPPIVPLDLALSVNRGATGDTLFGVRFFQPFVLAIRSFPAGGARRDRAVTHEILTSVAGRVGPSAVPERSWRYTDDELATELPISVAEVDGEHWQLSDDVNMLPLPVTPTRVNLWRLMAHALFTVDLRPVQPFAREAVESMMFGTPVIVPDHSAAKEHARAANGGLWYRNNGELLDAVRVLTDRDLREQLGRSGRSYAEAHHSDLGGFVARICEQVLPLHPGDPPPDAAGGRDPGRDAAG
jgi:hypothetical protein